MNTPMPAAKPKTPCTAVLLAGGRSLRMGQDKTLLQWQGQSLLQRVFQQLNQSVQHVLISGPQQLADLSPNLGPLGGIQAALTWLQQAPALGPWLLSCPCDTPVLPLNFAQRLFAQAHQQGALLVCSQYDGRLHYGHSLWHLCLLPALNAYLAAGQRSIKGFFEQQQGQCVPFPRLKHGPFFMNINTPNDYAALLAWSLPHAD